MSMIPWEDGIIVPPTDIGLPGWLGGTAGLLGFQFPDISERALLILGREYARLARNFEQSRESTDGVTSDLTVVNYGPAMTAFTLHRQRLSGPNGSHMIVSVSAAGAISAAYVGAAAVAVAMKIKAILALTEAALATAAHAVAAVRPEVLPGLLSVKAAVTEAHTVLAVIVAEGRQRIAALFDVAARVIELYTAVATPALRSRPPDEARGDITYLGVPGGLSSHEGASPNGGHTLLKHVNVDDRYIIDRVTHGHPPKHRASRWIDRQTAESVTAQVIGLNKATIAAWRMSSSSQRLTLHLGGGSGVTGWSVTGSDHTPRQVTGAVVILAKDPTRPDKYFILTSYPEP